MVEKMIHDKALIITKWWAGIFGTLLAAAIISAFGFAWNANSQQAVMQSKVEAQQQQLISLQSLPERMASMEATVKSTDRTVDTINQGMIEISRKLDVLARNQYERKPGR